jgi:hypothetical protein
MKKMKPIRCIFGRHSYKPSETQVYFCGESGGIWYYRADCKCCYCGNEREIPFSTVNPLNNVKEENG